MGFDLDEALERVGGDQELLKEIADLFLEDAPGLVDGIRAAIEKKDPEALQRAAHSLKGSVANFGAEETVALAFQLEQMGREGAVDDGAEAVFALLEAELQQVYDGLALVE